MRIIVFGASSRAGLYIVKEALEREHRVAAFTRRPEDFPLGHPKLDVIGGDLQDPAAVARAVQGAHGVIFCPGAGRRKAAAIPPKGLENLIRGMERAGCRRLVCLSPADSAWRGAGLRFSLALNWISRPRGSTAKNDQVGRLRASRLDWVLVRAPRLREGTGSGRLQVNCGGRPGRFIFLGDLAVFIVEELEKGRYLKKLPMVFSG